MEETPRRSSEKMEATALDVEFLPLVLVHKIHRNLKSSQVEIVPLPYYYKEPTPEPEEPEPEEPELDIPPPVVYAPPLPALKEKKNWWDFIRPVYAFNNPRIQSRIEKLMGSHIVQVMDRKYMTRLQERIREDYRENLKKRIQEREADEIEREKNLMLDGKIPYEDAPKELKNHPVCRINQLVLKIMEEKRAKMKSLDRTYHYRTSPKRIRKAEKALKEADFGKEPDQEDFGSILPMKCDVDAQEEEGIAKGLMFSKEDYESMKHEDPMIKLLREVDHVQEMYDLAEDIIGSVRAEIKGR